MRWIVLMVLGVLTSCGLRGVYYSEIISDHPNIINRPDSGIVYSYHIPFHKIEIKSKGRLMYHKIKKGSGMDVDTTLNAQGEWRRSGDTLFLNFPTYIEDSEFGYLMSSNGDTLTPLRRPKEVTYYLKR